MAKRFPDLDPAWWVFRIGPDGGFAGDGEGTLHISTSEALDAIRNKALVLSLAAPDGRGACMIPRPLADFIGVFPMLCELSKMPGDDEVHAAAGAAGRLQQQHLPARAALCHPRGFACRAVLGGQEAAVAVGDVHGALVAVLDDEAVAAPAPLYAVGLDAEGHRCPRITAA